MVDTPRPAVILRNSVDTLPFPCYNVFVKEYSVAIIYEEDRICAWM